MFNTGEAHLNTPPVPLGEGQLRPLWLQLHVPYLPQGPQLSLQSGWLEK